ncbi:hypothetical protein QBC34DRAFT_433399 [Podospora aff. communis PSN243]|uniref:F-box domain-containing protein n=1 Tax=Podospora aff. communis PSN243 TaxID=3040156 RepID=A0AAV9H442_9PEZI|nr:hypothetical protein QBC34DRAFT_433399 [Podospora aff. communis PSN243]
MNQIGKIDSSSSVAPLPEPPILKLPNELLIQILELVEGYDGRNPEEVDDWTKFNINDIRNCRLVCRRFHNLASSMLVREVRVSCRYRSIRRLEEISSRPLIARGVRIVKVDLARMAQTSNDSMHKLAAGMAVEFLWALRIQLMRQVPRNHKELSTASSCLDDLVWFVLHAHQRCDLGFLPELRRYLDDTSQYFYSRSPERDEATTTLVDKLHRDFQKLVVEYEEFKGGKFARLVGAALAKMPLATIRFEDPDTSYKWMKRLASHLLELGTHAALDECLHHRMLPLPVLRGTGECRDLNIVPEVAAAIHAAGGTVNNITVALDHQEEAPLSPPGEMRDSTQFNRLLSRFKYRWFDRSLLTDVRAEKGISRRTVFSFSGRCDMERLLVGSNLVAAGRARMQTTDITQLLDISTVYPKLQEMDLDGVCFRRADLLELARNLPPVLTSIRISNAYLLDGEWGHVFDALREKSYTAGVAFETLWAGDPNGPGARLPRFVSEEARGKWKEAEMYVMGRTTTNPAWRDVWLTGGVLA